MVDILIGTPPPAATPKRALSACGANDIEQGVFSPCVLTMATIGLSKSASSKPVPFKKPRCGARAKPSVTIRERCFPKAIELFQKIMNSYITAYKYYTQKGTRKPSIISIKNIYHMTKDQSR